MGTKPADVIEPSEFSLLSTLYPLLLRGKVCIIGVGNRLKGDDGAGPVLIDKISGRIDADCIDAGVAPENFLERIVRLNPDTVLIVDAVDFGGTPGEYRVFQPEKIVAGGISTHALSLQMVCDYLRKRISTSIFLIGIQPHRAGFGEELSSAVAETVRSLATILVSRMRRG